MPDPNKKWSDQDKADFEKAFNKGPSGKDIMERVAKLFGGSSEPAQQQCPTCGQPTLTETEQEP